MSKKAKSRVSDIAFVGLCGGSALAFFAAIHL